MENKNVYIIKHPEHWQGNLDNFLKDYPQPSLLAKYEHRYRRGQGSNTGIQAFFLQLSCVLMILSAFVSSYRTSNIWNPDISDSPFWS